MMDMQCVGDAIYLMGMGAFFSFLVMIIWVSLVEQDTEDDEEDDWAPWDLPADNGDDDDNVA